MLVQRLGAKCWGLGFKAGSRVQGLGFRFQGLWFRVWSLGLWIEELGHLNDDSEKEVLDQEKHDRHEDQDVQLFGEVTRQNETVGGHAASKRNGWRT